MQPERSKPSAALAAVSAPAQAAAVLAELFAPTGPLARHLPGFNPRPQQVEMAIAVADTIAAADTLICEAGTGTGKTFAYLVPALRSRRKVIVATGTRALQDQLFQRDLPVVRDALGLPLRSALLKGRSNYLCWQRFERTAAERLARGLRAEFARVRAWAAVTDSGDLAAVPLAEEAAIWPMITSTADNCLGQECPRWRDCFVLKARRQAQEADLVVVNHHLLCAHLALRDEVGGDILPEADCFIVDEAHRLPEVAASAFGVALSSHRLLELARDLEPWARRAAGYPALSAAREALIAAVGTARLAFGAEDRRGTWAAWQADAKARAAVEQVTERLRAVTEALAQITITGKEIEQLRHRGAELSARLSAWQTHDEPDSVRWFEVRGRGYWLHRTPLDVAEQWRQRRARGNKSWIFTSATLAVGDSFAHFAAQLGLDGARTARWESPFDYARQALWFVPRGMPDPATAEYDAAVAARAVELIELVGGRTFVLFTSHRALREVAEVLAARIAYPLLIQGSAPRAALLERFRQLGNAVLLGSASFWEGVDVRGEALSCVIVDRLPFAAPGDPLVGARIEALRRRGDHPFRVYQLPQAVVALKQAAGRLIRDASDRGLFVVCDPRLLRRNGYGAAFLTSLPPMARTRDLECVKAFLRGAPAAEAARCAGHSGAARLA